MNKSNARKLAAWMMYYSNLSDHLLAKAFDGVLYNIQPGLPRIFVPGDTRFYDPEMLLSVKLDIDNLDELHRLLGKRPHPYQSIEQITNNLLCENTS